MGSSSLPLSEASQILSQTVAARSDSSGNATFTFASPPNGFTWTGTLTCATAPIASVFLASVGAVSWGQWGGNSVYGPVQAKGAGAEQLKVTATGLTANTGYVLQWNGSSDPTDLVGAVWPDVNTSALQATIAGTVNANITGGNLSTIGSITNTVPVSGSLSTTAAGTTVNGSGFTGASTSITVASTTNFASSGYIGVPGSGGNLIFAYTSTTPTSFAGLTLIFGTAAWTIANGAAISQATPAPSSTNANITGGTLGSITNTVTTDNYSTQSTVASGNTTWTTSGTTNTLYNATTSGFRSFSVFMGLNSPSGTNYFTLTLTLTNVTTGQAQVIYMNSPIVNNTNAAFFGVGASPTDTLSLTIQASGVGVFPLTLSYSLVGYRSPGVQYVNSPPGVPTDVSNIGGSEGIVALNLAAGTASVFLYRFTNAQGAIALKYFTCRNETKSTIAGTVELVLSQGANNYQLAALPLTATTQWVGAQTLLNGLIIQPSNLGLNGANVDLYVVNNTTAAIRYSVFWDTLIPPTIN